MPFGPWHPAAGPQDWRAERDDITKHPLGESPEEEEDGSPAFPYHLGFVYSGSGAGGTATAPDT